MTIAPPVNTTQTHTIGCIFPSHPLIDPPRNRDSAFTFWGLVVFPKADKFRNGFLSWLAGLFVLITTSPRVEVRSILRMQ